MRKTLILIAALAAVSTAEAQGDSRPDSQACADSVGAGLYRRCALSLDGHRVRRGQEGVVVAQPGFFRPLSLTRVLSGDSAQANAIVFERKTRQATFFNIAGAVLIATGLVTNGCTAGLHLSSCSGSDGPAPAILMIGGSVVSVIGINIQVQANRAGARAVWWHNERFAR